MKKMYVLLMLIAVLFCVSAVSAAENISDGDVALEVDGNAVDDSITLESDDIVQKQEEDNVTVLKSDSNGADNKNVVKKSGSKTKKVVQVPSKLKAKNIKSTYGTKAKFTVKVLDKSKKVIANQKVVFKIGKKVVKTKTNSKGVATLKLNNAAGKYTIKYYAGKLSGKKTYTVKNFVSLQILKWDNYGDVSKVALIKKNMPNSYWVKKAVAATKKGNPLLKIKGGKGKVVFMTAGVHGNELSSQVAAMKLIDHLTKKPIKGTVYIIPFVNIKAISHKVRHTGLDYNRVAHKSGTIANNIVNRVCKYKCDAYGDFHTTQPGGAPGQNIVMGSKSPATKSHALTNYIAKNSKVNKRLYDYAGQEYPGGISDNVNMRKIPAVICEVVLPHNTVTASSVKISYSMMKSFLKFNAII